jgi:hypothetical protein
MDQHSFFPGRRVVDEPGFLEFQPGFGVEVVEFVFGHDLFNHKGQKLRVTLPSRTGVPPVFAARTVNRNPDPDLERSERKGKEPRRVFAASRRDSSLPSVVQNDTVFSMFGASFI